MAGPITDLQPIGGGKITDLQPINSDAPTTPFRVPSPGLQGSQTVQSGSAPSSAPGTYEPSTQWTDYPKEIAKGVGRGVAGTVQGAYQTVRHPFDTAKGLANQTIAMLDAGSQAAESGEGGLAGPPLAMLENAPIVGGAVRYAETGGTKPFNPKAVGAGAELGTYYAAPKAVEAGLGVAGRGVEAFRARQAFTDLVNQSEGIGRQAKTLNAIDKGAQAVFNRAQNQVLTLKARLVQDAQTAIQPALDADKAAGEQPLFPTKAVVDVHNAMEKTKYTPTAKEQAILDSLAESPEDGLAKKLGYPNAEDAKAQVGANVWNDFVQKNGTQGGGLTLEKALQLRSTIGGAAKSALRGGNAKAHMVLTSAYEGMNDTINGHLNALEGKPGAVDASGKPAMNSAFKQYNKNHKAAFELDDGFTADLQDKPLDHHEARGKLSSFTGANLTQVTKQMRGKGIDPNEFMQLQKDAKAVLNAHGSVMGKFNKSVMRQIISGSPADAALPMGVLMASKGAGLYGFVPYMLATMAGKLGGQAGAMMDFGNVLRRLDISKELLDTRTQPGPLVPTKFPQAPAPEAPTKAEAIRKAKANK